MARPKGRPGSGSCRPRRNGVWQLDYVDAHGNRQRVSSGTRDGDAAQRQLDDICAQEADRAHRLESGELFWEEAVALFSQSIETESTAKTYAFAAQALAPYLEGRMLSEIKSDDFRTIITDFRRRGLSDGSIRVYLALVKSAYRHAGHTENPVSTFLATQSKRYLKRAKQVVRYLSEHEEEVLLSCFNKQIHQDMAVLAIETGLRKRELLELEWRHVHMARREIRLGQDTKSGKPRTIPLTDRAYEVLSRQTTGPRARWVFWRRSKDGIKLYSDTSAFLRAAKRRAVEIEPSLADLRWHDLRHTFGTRCASYGVNMEYLRRMMGHQSLEETQKYTHADVDDLHMQMQEMERRKDSRHSRDDDSGSRHTG